MRGVPRSHPIRALFGVCAACLGCRAEGRLEMARLRRAGGFGSALGVWPRGTPNMGWLSFGFLLKPKGGHSQQDRCATEASNTCHAATLVFAGNPGSSKLLLSTDGHRFVPHLSPIFCPMNDSAHISRPLYLLPEWPGQKSQTCSSPQLFNPNKR